MARVERTDQALDEFDLIVASTELFDPGAITSVGACPYARRDGLADFRRSGRPAAGDGCGMTTVLPYSQRYDTDGGGVRSLSVRHDARHSE